MPSTTPKGATYPLGSDAAASLDTIVQSLAEWVDANPGVASLTTAARDALPASGKWVGRIIYNLTAARLEHYTAGNVWVPVLTVGTENILTNAITTALVANGSITTAKLADQAVDAFKLANGAVNTAKIGDGQVTNAKLAAGSVSGDKIAEDGIWTSHLQNGSVNSSKLGLGAVGTGNIAANAVTDEKVGAPAVATIVLGGVLTCHLHRLGFMVFMSYSGSAAAAGTYTGVIPAGYRPAASVGLHTGQFNVIAEANSAGSIFITGGPGFLSGAWSTGQ